MGMESSHELRQSLLLRNTALCTATSFSLKEVSAGPPKIFRAFLLTGIAGTYYGGFLPVNLESISHSSVK